MLGTIRTFFERHLSPEANDSEQDQEHCLRLATAALLLELSLSDAKEDPRETSALMDILKTRYALTTEELDTLLSLAREEAQEATSLFQFTSLFNEHYDYPQKVALISHLWEIAFADGRLDRYEEHTIRTLADLLYISHSDFIRTKLQVRDANPADG